MKITGLSHLFKWENLHNWWLTKYCPTVYVIFFSLQHYSLVQFEYLVFSLYICVRIHYMHYLGVFKLSAFKHFLFSFKTIIYLAVTFIFCNTYFQ